MQSTIVELSVKGKNVRVPSLEVDGKRIILSGRWIKMATIQDEAWLEGNRVDDPAALIAKLTRQKPKADIFAFSQRLPETAAKYPYPFEWDNLAVIPITTFEDWWEKRLSQETRRNVRKAAKQGVVVKSVELTDELLHGIHGVYNSTVVRQGIPNVHFGKTFETIKQEASTFPGQSEFIGAYLGSELIGFIKLVYVGKTAGILHIVSKIQHHDKRPTNALVAKAVEICAKKGMSHLLYLKYQYGNKTGSPLTEFKRRNGFEKVLIPRYFVPLSLKGRIIVKLRLHRGLLEILPPRVISMLLSARARYFRVLFACKHWLRPATALESGGKNQDQALKGAVPEASE